jgi:K+-sensing histidine kinase KdpD
VAISAERREATWLFSVRDNGVGVPRDLGDEIFSMFKRAHGDDVEGCGIGLAVCRKIVEAHGGAIWAEPADGAGTVMRFTVAAT